MKIALIVAGTSYLFLGIVGGLMERAAWRRCNTLRTIILELSQVEDRDAIKTRFVDETGGKSALPVYCLAFLIIGISFAAAVYLASGIQSQKDPLPQAEQVEGVPNSQLQATQ